MFARTITLRKTVLCAFFLAALCAFAGPKTKEPAPRFNAKTTEGEKFTNDLAAMYEATVYPIYVVIDRDGNIAGTQRGAAGEEALRDLLASGGIGPKDGSDTQ